MTKAWVGRNDGADIPREFPDEDEATRYLHDVIEQEDPEGVHRGDYFIDVDRGES